VSVCELHELPDAGDGMCCYGAAVFGPDRCTCWKAEHDVEQQPVVEGEPSVRPSMCADCAFRPGSPERSGDERYEHAGDDDIDELVYAGVSGGALFFCHQGMRRRLRSVHPSGVVVDCAVDAYAPLVVGKVAYKADGTPADICAGFAAAVRRAEEECDDEDGCDDGNDCTRAAAAGGEVR
jgi:hypothetical protein